MSIKNPNFDAKAFCKNLPTGPGVYQMLGEAGKVLYVGKARNLKNRVKSYFQKNNLNDKTKTLVSNILNIEIILASSENEALLLESNLIKQFQPRYNVLLRDDKSYPYLFISTGDDYPRLDVHRGKKEKKGRYFGPYPSAGSVRQTLNLLQKLFRIRQCEQSYFASRTRPCLQYQIKRCTAPCVDYISKSNYAKSIQYAIFFLDGKSQQIIDELIQKMQAYSDGKHFEQAATMRDRIAKLRHLQAQQNVTGETGDTDVIAALTQESTVVVQVLYIRNGRMIGSKAYYPKIPQAFEPEMVLQSFLEQFYLQIKHEKDIPQEIILNQAIPEKEWLAETIGEHKKRKVKINTSSRGIRSKWLGMATQNAEQSLRVKLSSKNAYLQKFTDCQKLLDLDDTPNRIECFDISHSSGEATVAACVVFDISGPAKKSYRRFNIKDITEGDDYAAMRQALTRHYKRALKEERLLPEVLLIDGGKGQLRAAQTVLESLAISSILLIGICKGEGRRASEDKLLLIDAAKPLDFNEHTKAGHLLQEVRDEAHRFAITGHRKQRDKRRVTSILEQIEGIGAKRRQELLKQFGGLQELRRASLDDIAKAPGISIALAKKVYKALNS